MSVAIVVARAENGVIGAAGTIPWHIPADFAHFKTLTMGHPMVMGRLTFESIGRPLPGRTSIVVTQNPDWAHESVVVCHSIEAAVQHARSLDSKVFVIGGAHIYRQALEANLVDTIICSQIPLAPQGDTFFHIPPGWEPIDRETQDGFELITYAQRPPIPTPKR